VKIINPVSLLALYEIIRDKGINILHEEFLRQYAYKKERIRHDKAIKCWLVCTNEIGSEWKYKIKINDEDLRYISGNISKSFGSVVLARSQYYCPELYRSN